MRNFAFIHDEFAARNQRNSKHGDTHERESDIHRAQGTTGNRRHYKCKSPNPVTVAFYLIMGRQRSNIVYRFAFRYAHHFLVSQCLPLKSIYIIYSESPLGKRVKHDLPKAQQPGHCIDVRTLQSLFTQSIHPTALFPLRSGGAAAYGTRRIGLRPSFSAYT